MVSLKRPILGHMTSESSKTQEVTSSVINWNTAYSCSLKAEIHQNLWIWWRKWIEVLNFSRNLRKNKPRRHNGEKQKSIQVLLNTILCMKKLIVHFEQQRRTQGEAQILIVSMWFDLTLKNCSIQNIQWKKRWLRQSWRINFQPKRHKAFWLKFSKNKNKSSMEHENESYAQWQIFWNISIYVVEFKENIFIEKSLNNLTLELKNQKYSGL